VDESKAPEKFDSSFAWRKILTLPAFRFARRLRRCTAFELSTNWFIARESL
jgi:hypothetical protein